MATEVILPQLGESVAEGIITRWLKQPGESVALDEPLVEISTDKVNVELPSPVAGTVKDLLAAEGETVPVEHVIALIEPIEGGAPAAAVRPAENIEQHPIAEEEVRPSTGTEPVRLHFSGLVKRIAREHGLDLEFLVRTGRLQGTGEGGRVTKSDVLAYLDSRGTEAAEAQPTLPAREADGQAPLPSERVERTAPVVPVTPAPQSDDEIVVPFTGMRRMIADHLVKSAFTAPHVTTVAQADVTRLVEFRAANKDVWQRDYGLKLTYTPFFVRAVADALLAYPMVNSTLQGDRILARKYVHMGVAVSLGEGGLIVPVIRNAHQKDVVQIARELEEIARKARDGKLAPSDVQGGTFTITNPGVFGAILSTPIIHAPQSAILGVEAIQKQVVVRDDDSLAIRSMMYLCLSYDHRVIDGETAIKFLQTVRRTLEDFRFLR